MMFFEIVTLIFLLVIVLELGWIIYRGVRVPVRSQDDLTAAKDALIKARELWKEDLRELALELSRIRRDFEALPPANFKPASSLPEGYTAELLATLEALSSSITGLRQSAAPSYDELGERLATYVERFQTSAGKLYKSVGEAVSQLIEERQQFVTVLKSQSKVQQEDIRSLTKALLDALQQATRAMPEGPSFPAPARSLASAQPVAEATSPTSPSPPASAVPVVTPLKTADAAPQAMGATTVEPPPVSGTGGTDEPTPDTAQQAVTSAQSLIAPRRSSAEFAPLHNWVTSNLDKIMSRSLNRWSKPEDLLCDAPADLRYTARILDPDSKLVLIGTNDDSQYLALALPGSRIDANYYEWFSLPNGPRMLVGRTRIPAFVDANTTGYQVLERGVIE
ncbi:MAG: hypothetical protein WCF57_19745 [Pyrinomonadaceae bacterium]